LGGRGLCGIPHAPVSAHTHLVTLFNGWLVLASSHTKLPFLVGCTKLYLPPSQPSRPLASTRGRRGRGRGRKRERRKKRRKRKSVDRLESRLYVQTHRYLDVLAEKERQSVDGPLFELLSAHSRTELLKFGAGVKVDGARVFILADGDDVLCVGSRRRRRRRSRSACVHRIQTAVRMIGVGVWGRGDGRARVPGRSGTGQSFLRACSSRRARCRCRAP